MNLMIFDLSTVTFRRSAGEVFLSLPGMRDVLALTPGPDASDREIVFELLDRALAELRIPTRDEWVGTGLYNPLTAQIAVGGIPDTETFADGGPLGLDLYGTPALLLGGVLTVTGRELLPVEASTDLVRRSLAAHAG